MHDVSEWVSVSEAEARTGVPRRTIYSRVERHRLASKVVDGNTHVLLSDVTAVAMQRAAAPAPSTSERNSPAQVTAPPPAQPELHQARTRVELRKAEADELRATEAVRLARDEVLAAEAERAERHKRLALENERQRVELDSARREAELRWRRQTAAVEAESAERERAARREDARRRREADARCQREQRESWIAAWLDDVTRWTLASLGADAVRSARAAAQRVLDGLPHSTRAERVQALIDRELQVDLAGHIAAAESARRQAKRENLVNTALLHVMCTHTSNEWTRIRDAACAAAAFVDPDVASDFWGIVKAAKTESVRIEEECQVRKAEVERRRSWAAVFAKLPGLVREALSGANSTARERALGAVLQFYNDRPPELEPWQFEAAVVERVKLLSGE